MRKGHKSCFISLNIKQILDLCSVFPKIKLFMWARCRISANFCSMGLVIGSGTALLERLWFYFETTNRKCMLAFVLLDA